MPTRVAVDAMGGDHAPAVIVEGAVRAARGAPDRMEVLLFGPEDALRDALAGHDTAGLCVEVVHAPEFVGMGESPSAVLKGKPRSSIHLGLRAVAAGEADAFVSAGNTGAVMAAALVLCGRLPGVLRPTLPGLFPTPRGTTLVLDVGANVDCKAEHLAQFALMGHTFARRVYGTADPSVALLNVGEERGKGTEVVKEAYERLEALGREGRLRFVGNLEGRDLFHHKADVAVCDGFVGNLLLKLGESFATVLPRLIGREIERQGLGEAETALLRGVIRSAMRPFDYENHGAVPLLGVAGNVLVGHGGSNARAAEQMLYRACEVAEQRLPETLAEALRDRQPLDA